MPSGNFKDNLGNGQFALDPSILTSLKLGPTTYFQGQFGNWVPLGGPGTNRKLAGGIFYWLMSFNQVLCYTTPDSPLIATLEMDGWSFENGGYTPSITGPSRTPLPHPTRPNAPHSPPSPTTPSRTAAACRTSTSARASVSRSAIELTSAAPSPGRPTAPPTGHSPGSASRCGSCSDVEASRAGQELSAAASSRKWERVRQQRRQGTINPVCVVVL